MIVILLNVGAPILNMGFYERLNLTLKINVGCKDSQVTNTVTYLFAASGTNEKKFYEIDTRPRA